MGLVTAVLVVAVVFAIAAVVIGREARRLGHEAPQAVFDMDEAVEFVARHVPFEVSAKLSYEDVRHLIAWHLEMLRRSGAMGNGDGSVHEGPVVMAGSETVAALLGRAAEAGLDADATDIHHVVEAEMTYLESIGAINQTPEGEADGPTPPGGNT